MNGSRPKRLKAQASLEMVLALIIFGLLLLGTVRIFVWLNKSFVDRQEAYNNSRINYVPQPGYYDNKQVESPQVNFYQPQRFHIFSEGK